MRRLMMKKTLFTSLLFASSFLFGENTSASCPVMNQEMMANQSHQGMMMGYNAPCGIRPDGAYGFFIAASFLYYQPLQENMNLGIVSNSRNPLDLLNGYEVALNFRYKPGFKISGGMSFDYDRWDSVLTYTWFHATEKKSVQLNTVDTQIGIFPAWEIPNFLNPEYHYGSENWQLKMDLVDWNFGRSSQIGKALCVRSFLGLRAAWIRQNLHVNYINVNPSYAFMWPSQYISLSSSSWGLGPEAGLGCDWTFAKGWRIHGDGELDLIFTQYDLKSFQRSNETVANRYIVSSKDVNTVRTHLELNLGLGWGTYLYQRRFLLDFLASYGFQVFFDQNMFRVPANTQAYGKSTVPNGNLYLQGLTLTGRFDF